MKCPRCQHENPPQSRFCFECGARLALACGNCGTEIPAGVKFCNQCGQPVGIQPAAQVRFPSPESYTPKHLAEYGLPAAVGTGFATRHIKTGQKLRVDGNNGTVTILS